MDHGFQGAIFDLDGTVLDTMKIWNMVDRNFLGKRGLPMDKEYLDTVKTLSYKQSVVYAIRYFNLRETPSQIIDEWETTAMAAYKSIAKLKPGAAEYIRYLKDGGVKIAAATSSHTDHAPESLKLLGIYDMFDHFVFTSDAPRPKGYPDIYNIAAERMGLEPKDCAVFEDLPVAVRAARLGGFHTVAVFEEYYVDYWDDISVIANRAIKSFYELLPTSQGEPA